MNELDISARIKNYIESNGLTVNNFAQKVGIDPGNLRKMLQGKQTITSKTLQKISTTYGINLEWLKTGNGEKSKLQEIAGSVDSRMDNVEQPSSDNLRRINAQLVPLIPVEAFAGSIARLLSDGVSAEKCRKIIAPMAGAEMAIPVSGDSMEPVIHDGAIIYLARINDRAFIPWGNIMVLDTENGALVKEVYPSPTDTDAVQVRSINPKYPSYDIPKESIRGLYRVLGFSKYYTTL